MGLRSVGVVRMDSMSALQSDSRCLSREMLARGNWA
jgi:hypothetical protein